MIHKVNPKCVPSGYAAITWLPWLAFYNSASAMTERCKRHENIHGRQQAEMLVVAFYLWYGIEYLFFRYVKGFSHKRAYVSISFEKEARENDRNLEYIKYRKLYGWIKFL